MTLAIGVLCQDGFLLCSDGFSLVYEENGPRKELFVRKIYRLKDSGIVFVHSGLRSVAEKARERLEKDWNPEKTIEDLVSLSCKIISEMNDYVQYAYYKEREKLGKDLSDFLKKEENDGLLNNILTEFQNTLATESKPNLETGAFLAGYHQGEEIFVLITPDGSIVEPKQVVAIGAGSRMAQDHLRKHIKRDMTIKDAVPIVFESMRQGAQNLYANDVLFPAVITVSEGYQDYFDQSEKKYQELKEEYVRLLLSTIGGRSHGTSKR